MLEVNNLRVRYGSVEAVRGVSLTVAQGETVALLGSNGAGKSSTLLALAGANPVAGGQVELNGRDITGLSPERRVRHGLAMVPETRDIFPDLTVAENLRLGAFIRRHQPQAVAEDQARLLNLFPILAERAGQTAGTLSGGEQQMLAMARAMMSRPRLLLLDEPSLGLAPAIVERVFELITQLKQTGLTVLLVEQNAAQALAIADRAYVMRLGQIAASGSATEVASGFDLKKLYLGE